MPAMRTSRTAMSVTTRCAVPSGSAISTVALVVGLAAEETEAMLRLPLDAGGRSIWARSIWRLRLRARSAGEWEQNGGQHGKIRVTHDISTHDMIDGVPIACEVRRKCEGAA